MALKSRVIASAAALLALIAVGEPAFAQLGSLKKKAEDKAKKELEKQTEQAAPQTPVEGNAAEPAAGEPAEKAAPGEGVWVNYDFVPGNRVLFFDDLTADQVGNFPQRLEFVEGNMEVAEWNQSRWLRVTTASKFTLPLPEVLPDRFTLEFDMYIINGWSKTVVSGAPLDGGNPGTVIWYSPLDNFSAGLVEAASGKRLALGPFPQEAMQQVMHCRAIADGKYMKVYVNETRTANVPNVSFARSNKIHFEIAADATRPQLLGNFRIAAGDKKMYDALAANGRVTTHGILFDSGADKIRPESTPTLKEISQMLTEHADLKLMIEGHTDAVGDDASNLSLSERRAAAVKSYLAANFSVDEARLSSKGFGETKPAAANDTAEGRQNNRRVELVKL